MNQWRRRGITSVAQFSKKLTDTVMITGTGTVPRSVGVNLQPKTACSAESPPTAERLE